MSVYYNDTDEFAAEWLRQLIKQRIIADGVVDTRSIVDVTPNDVMGFTQCHFFAGIGVWSYALRQAGWPDDRQIWTGSCPCQPFSVSGKGKGFTDERHLWPAFHHLIRVCRPDTVLGEQVASKNGLAWLDLVQADMEGEGYSVGAVDTCAAGFGAPHIRQRLYWVADRNRELLDGGWNRMAGWRSEYSDRSVPCGMGDSIGTGLERHRGYGCNRGQSGRFNENTARSATSPGAASGVADTNKNGCIQRDGIQSVCPEHDVEHGRTKILERPGPTNGFWSNPDWLCCRDGKWRPVRSGSFPLVTGAIARVGRLRGYGNAINAEQAKAFIEAYLEIAG